MTSVDQTLVILLSVGMIVLLILSIVLVSLLIAVVQNVRRVAQRAERATENISDLAATISQRLAPVAASSIMAALVRRFVGKPKKERKHGSDE